MNIEAIEKILSWSKASPELKKWLKGEEVEDFDGQEALTSLFKSREDFYKDKYSTNIDLEEVTKESYIATAKPITNLIARVTGKSKEEVSKLKLKEQVELALSHKDEVIGKESDTKYNELLEKHNALIGKFDEVAEEKAKLESGYEEYKTTIDSKYKQAEEARNISKLKRELLSNSKNIEFDKSYEFYEELLPIWEQKYGVKTFVKTGANGKPELGIRAADGSEKAMAIDGQSHYDSALQFYRDIAKEKRIMKVSNGQGNEITAANIIKTKEGKVINTNEAFLKKQMAAL